MKDATNGDTENSQPPRPTTTLSTLAVGANTIAGPICSSPMTVLISQPLIPVLNLIQIFLASEL